MNYLLLNLLHHNIHMFWISLTSIHSRILEATSHFRTRCLLMSQKCTNAAAALRRICKIKELISAAGFTVRLLLVPSSSHSAETKAFWRPETCNNSTCKEMCIMRTVRLFDRRWRCLLSVFTLMELRDFMYLLEPEPR